MKFIINLLSLIPFLLQTNCTPKNKVDRTPRRLEDIIQTEEQQKNEEKTKVLEKIKEVAKGYVPKPGNDQTSQGDLMEEGMKEIANSSNKELEETITNPNFKELEGSIEQLSETDTSDPASEQENQDPASEQETPQPREEKDSDPSKYAAGLALVTIGAVGTIGILGSSRGNLSNGLPSIVNGKIEYKKLSNTSIDPFQDKVNSITELRENLNKLNQEIKTLEHLNDIERGRYEVLTEKTSLSEQEQDFIKKHQQRSELIVNKELKMLELDIALKDKTSEPVEARLKHGDLRQEDLDLPEGTRIVPYKNRNLATPAKHFKPAHIKKFGIYGAVAASLVAITSGSVMMKKSYGLNETSKEQHDTLYKIDDLVKKFRQLHGQ